MRRDARRFAAYDPNGFAARRQFPTHQLLNGERVRDVICEWRQVIEPVRVRHELVVLHVLGDFLIAPVQVADVRSCLGDCLAIEFENEAQDAVSGRMRWSHVEDHFLADVAQVFAHLCIRCGDARNGIRGFDFARRESHVATLRLCWQGARAAQVQKSLSRG